MSYEVGDIVKVVEALYYVADMAYVGQLAEVVGPGSSTDVVCHMADGEDMCWDSGEVRLATPAEIAQWAAQKALSSPGSASKPRWDVLPWEAVQAVVDAFNEGIQPAEDSLKQRGILGWRDMVASVGLAETRRIYRDALCRHVAALMRGEALDPKTGRPHAVHIACNGLILADLELLAVAG